MEKVYKLDTAIYGIATDNYNEFITNYNDVVEVSNIKSERSSKPTSWEDVFIDKNMIQKIYTYHQWGICQSSLLMMKLL